MIPSLQDLPIDQRQYVRELVAAAPELSAEQQLTLKAIFAGTDDGGKPLGNEKKK